MRSSAATSPSWRRSRRAITSSTRRPDAGRLLIFDMCPSQEAYRAFFDSDAVRLRFADCGLRLDDAVVEDFPVTRAYARRAALTDASWDVA